MAVRIGPTIGIEGEREFRASLRRIVQEANTLDAEMKLMTATFNQNESALSKNAKTRDALTERIRKQTQVIENDRRMVDEAQKAEERAYKTREQQKKKVEELTNEYNKEAKLLETVRNNVGENNYVTAQHKEKLDQLGKELKKATDDLDAMNVGVQRAGEVTSNWKEQTAKAELELRNLEKQLHNIPNAFMVVGQGIENVGEKIMGFGDKITQFVTVPLVGAASASVKFASDFQDRMAKVYTIADESVVPIDEMADGLKRLSDSSGFSLDDLAEAAYQAVSASVKTEDAVDFLADATKLARAGFTDTTTAVDILSTVMNTYGHNAYSAAEISDILLKTQNDGKTVVGDLANRMGIIIPMAKNYGVSLEQIAAGYATMTKQGVKTEQATTYFRAMFTELEKESSDVSKLLDTLTGKSFKQLMDSGMDIADVLKLLWDYVGGDSEAFQRLFGNVRSTQAVAALAAGDFSILRDELAAMENTTGLVNEALETLQTPGLQARKTINRLKNASEEFGEDLLKDLLPTLEKVVDFVEKWTTAYRNADKPTRDLVKNVVLLTGAIGPGVKIAGGAIKTIGSVTKSFGAFAALLSNGVIPGVTGVVATVGALLPAVAAVGAALGGLYIYTKYTDDQFQHYIETNYGLRESEKKLVEASNASTESMKALHATSLENVKAVNDNYDAVGPLIERYNALVGENGELKEGSEGLADVLLNEIAEALGIDAEKVQELIEENGHLGESIDAVIEKRKQEAMLDAYRDEYVASLKEQAKHQKEIVALEKAYADAQSDTARAQKEFDEVVAQMNAADARGENTVQYASAWKEASAALKMAKAREEELKTSLDGEREALNGATNMVENYELAMEMVETGSADASTAVDMLVEDFKRAGSSTSQELYNQYLMYKQHYEDVKDGIDSGGNEVSEAEQRAAKFLLDQATQEWIEYDQMAKQGAEKASKDEATGVGMYATEAGRNAGRQKQMTMNGYKDNGEAGRIGSGQSKDYANSVDDYKWTANSNAGSVVDMAISGLDDGGRAYARGEDFGLGYASGLTTKAVINGVVSGAASLVNLANNTIASKQQSGSPSKVAAERGGEFGEGYALGIRGTSPLVTSAADSLVKSALVDSMAMDNMASYGGWSSARTVNAPINVNVTVNGNVDDYGELADVIADRINTQVLQKQGAF